MEGKDAEKMDSESPFRLSSGCLFVYVGGLSDDGVLFFRPCIEHAPAGCSLRAKGTKEQYQFPLGTTAWRISEEYGWREDPLTGKEAFHKGVDLACASGTIVLAGADGIVAAARHSQSYGNYLRLSHAKGEETLYAHMQYLYVRTGEVVKAGEPIGTVGQTGRATGAHLHLEWLCNGIRYDPAGIFHFL